MEDDNKNIKVDQAPQPEPQPVIPLQVVASSVPATPEQLEPNFDRPVSPMGLDDDELEEIGAHFPGPETEEATPVSVSQEPAQPIPQPIPVQLPPLPWGHILVAAASAGFVYLLTRD